MNTETYTPGELICNDYPVATSPVTLASGQNLKRGAVLGKITADGKYTLALAASADGSEEPKRVLAIDTDATAGDTVTHIYESGAFDASKLALGDGVSSADLEANFRDASAPLFVKTIS